MTLRQTATDHVLEADEADFQTAGTWCLVRHVGEEGAIYASQACFRFGGFRSGRLVVVHDARHALQEYVAR